MNYIQVNPVLRDGRFRAVIEVNPDEIAEPLVFRITARRNDGVYETRELTFPGEDGLDGSLPFDVDFFALRRGDYAQIIAVKVNDRRVNIHFAEIEGVPQTHFRYDDSVIRRDEFVAGNVHLDFQVIPTGDPAVLLVADHSRWGPMIYHEAVMEITPPGYEESVSLYWGKERVNAFNSLLLGLSCVKDCEPQFEGLPDGVYAFLLRAADGAQAQRMFLKTDLLQLRIDRLRIAAITEERSLDAQKSETVRRAGFYLAAAESSLRLGNFLKGSDFYRMADRLTQNC